MTKDGNAVLVLDDGAEPILDYFRGVGPPPPVARTVTDRPVASGAVTAPGRMKALILAGGAGTRLRPITHTRAKQLVPVANTPILHYGIHSMVAAGITELGVIVGDTRDEVMAGLGDGSQFGASITYIPQDEPLGLAHCVLIARDFLGDDDFVMYLGDNLLEQDLAAFVDAFAAARARRAIRRRRRSCSSRCPIRTGSASPRSTTPATSSTWSRSRPTRRRTSRSSASTCSIRRSTKRWRPSNRPSAANSRSPTPSSG